MAMKINFGWLHDFSGNKFAPFTLADKILLNQRGTETVTLLDYFDNKMGNLEAHQAENHNDLTELKRFRVLLTKSPFEIESILQDDTIGEREWAYGAKMLLETPQWGIGEDGLPHDQGISRGSSLIPVYFDNGVPQECNNGEIINKFHNEGTIKDILKEIKPISDEKVYDLSTYTQGNSSPFENAIQINISGTAKTADEAAHATVSDMAYQSLQTYYSNLTYGFKEPIIFNKDDGDINGNITTDVTNETITNTSKIVLNEIDPIERGAEYINNDKTYMSINYYDDSDVVQTPGKYLIGGVKGSIDVGGETRRAMTIPVFSIDKKGRIREIKEEIAIPVINVKTYDKKSGKLGIVCWNGQNEDAKFTGTRVQEGVYVEWPNDKEYPIIKGAAYNDYAEYRRSIESIPAGYCVASSDKGEVYKTSKKFQACDGIVSDTFGFAIGSEYGSVPLAVAGRVLAYYEGDINDYHSGDTVCAGPEGKVCKMTREEIKKYPDRIIGIVSEIPNYEKWNGIKVNNRIWIKVK